MTLKRRKLLREAVAGTATLLAAPAILRAQGTVPVRVGEINSYGALPALTQPYRNGWQMARDEVNAAGGIGGRPLDVISRDDGGQAETAAQLAIALLDEQKVDILAGGWLAEPALAISSVSLQRKRLFIAGAPLTDALVWAQGHRYCFRLRPSIYMQVAMLVEKALSLPATRWAVVAPNDAEGAAAAAWFKQLASARAPWLTFVAEPSAPPGKLDPTATVAALAAARPEAIFNATQGIDLAAFVREGMARGLFADRSVLSLLTGEPEHLEALGANVPQGWFVTGYPVDTPDMRNNAAFVAAYQARFNERPKMASVIGYVLIKSMAAAIGRSPSMDVETLVESGFEDATFDTPFGYQMYRAQDHQGTLGMYVGTLAVADGRGVMVESQYYDGQNYLPSTSELKKLRPANN